jgi:uncharacterized protein (TIGR00252 family)
MKTNYAAGHSAEQAAALYLKSHGFKVLDINWSTKYCEIDIVAQKNKTIFFAEVKYRKSTNFGSGFDYITPTKLKQMKFAAELWVSHFKWNGDYQLAAVEMSGDNEVLQLLTEL